MNLIRYTILSALLSVSTSLCSQNQTVVYPKIKAYFGILHPIFSYSDKETTLNFRDYYAIGFPTGINIWKNEKIGYSFEVVPTIRVENGTDKMNSLLFHPGILVSLGKGFTFAGRLAFDTGGRYGLTPIISKTIIKREHCSYYIATPFPIRLGNDHPATVGANFQFGISF